MTWNPEPIAFERRGDRILASGWPEQIEVARSLLAVADPALVFLDGPIITFRLNTGQQQYRVIGDRGDDVLLCERLDMGTMSD